MKILSTFLEQNSRRSFLCLLLGFALTSCGKKKGAEDLAKEIVQGIEKTIKEEKEGSFVLTCFINGSIEIVSNIKPANQWDDEYKKSLEDEIILTIKRGGMMFQLFQLTEREKKDTFI